MLYCVANIANIYIYSIYIYIYVCILQKFLKRRNEKNNYVCDVKCITT